MSGESFIINDGVPYRERNSQWYEDTFASRWETIIDYDQYNNQDSLIFGALALGIRLRKSAPVLLSGVNEKFELLSASNAFSGYRAWHSKIRKEYGSAINDGNFTSGLLLEDVDENRYLLLHQSSFDFFKDQEKYVTRIKDMMRRYRVKYIFNAGLSSPQINSTSDDMIIAEDNTGVVLERMVWDGFCMEVAEEYHMSISEYLRFKVAHELPTRITVSNDVK